MNFFLNNMYNLKSKYACTHTYSHMNTTQKRTHTSAVLHKCTYAYICIYACFITILNS